MSLFQTTGLIMEDALAASNLASAVADIKEYGSTHILQITSAQDAYDIYREALRTNLGLDDNWENAKLEWISGKVEVLQYTVYNVRDQDVTIYSFSEQGDFIREEKDGLGSVRTPDGTLVESTSVYSRIGFPVEGILGITVYAEKDNTVDLVAASLDQTASDDY